MNYFVYDTKLGPVTIAEEDGALRYLTTLTVPCLADADRVETPLIRKAAQQLTEYLDGKRKTFHLPLCIKGTRFQQMVWKALCTIPYGHTRTYKQIAESIGRPRSYRAVGRANHANPLLLVVPCHRIIGANGKLVGYAAGIEKKEFLLRLESIIIC